MTLRRAAFASAPIVASLACSCSGAATQGGPPPGCAAAADAVWAASDYSSSAVGSLALGGDGRSTAGAVDLGADPVLAASGGHFFLVARDQDAVFELDPRCGAPMSRFSVHQASHVGPSNPQDVAVASDGTRWIPMYDVPTLAVFAADGTPVRTLDLSAYDGDGNPNASRVEIVSTPAGEKAFVTLERLDDENGLRSDQPSWMLRVDVATATVETHVVLAGRNPFSLYRDGAVLWLAEPGNFDDAAEPDAGIERFDTSTSTTALLLHEADLGGSVAQVAVSGGCGLAVVADPTPNVNATSLVTWDAARGAVLLPAARAPLATPGFDLEGLDFTGGAAAMVGDRRRAADGYPVHAFDAGASCALAQRPDAVFLPLPPVDVRSITSPSP
jgi:hypothetical protein